MTEGERFVNVMEFRSVDRVPRYEMGLWGQTLERWFNEGLPRDVLYMEAYDGEPYFSNDRRGWIRINVKSVPSFDEEILEETDRYIVSRRSDGRITKAMKEGTVRGTRPSMDQYLEFPVKSRKDFEKIKKRYNPNSAIRYPLWWDEMVRAWTDRTYPLFLPENGKFGLYWTLREWVGTENLSTMFYDDSILVHEMLDFLGDFIIEVTGRALSTLQIDCFNFVEDFAYKTGPLISPKTFRKFFMPVYKRVIGHFRKHGIKYFWLDSDGNLEVLLPLLLECGITCSWPLEQAAGMDPVKLRKEYGKDIVLCGGIDKREIAKDKKSIEKELYNKLPFLLEQGGYIPTLDHTFPPDISYENFLYYTKLKDRIIEGRGG